MTGLDELFKVEERVIYLLTKVSHLRDCDACLLLSFWGTFEKRMNCHLRTSAETITRARRKVQARGVLMPTDDAVLIRRGFKSEVIKEWVRE